MAARIEREHHSSHKELQPAHNINLLQIRGGEFTVAVLWRLSRMNLTFPVQSSLHLNTYPLMMENFMHSIADARCSVSVLCTLYRQFESLLATSSLITGTPIGMNLKQQLPRLAHRIMVHVFRARYSNRPTCDSVVTPGGTLACLIWLVS